MVIMIDDSANNSEKMEAFCFSVMVSEGNQSFLRRYCLEGTSNYLFQNPIAALCGARNHHVLLYTPVSPLRPACSRVSLDNK